jgi:hypothetical protein
MIQAIDSDAPILYIEKPQKQATNLRREAEVV